MNRTSGPSGLGASLARGMALGGGVALGAAAVNSMVGYGHGSGEGYGDALKNLTGITFAHLMLILQPAYSLSSCLDLQTNSFQSNMLLKLDPRILG